MEDSEFIERLDSLWFFSNVLSLRSLSMAASDTGEKFTDQFSLNHSPKPEVIKPAVSPIAQNGKNQIENADSPAPVVQLQRYPDCGEFAPETETETQMAKTEFLEEVLPKRRRRRRRSRRSFKSCLDQRKMDVGESDLRVKGLDVDEMGFGVNLVVCGNWDFEGASGYHVKNQIQMPPLTDGIAMKQHLKSWAYAVACTVR